MKNNQFLSKPSSLTKNCRIINIFIILWIVSATAAFAHPGNTDSSGGHTCRTNCEKWGLSYGEYHYHNSIPETSVSGYEDGYDEGYELAYSYTSQCEEEYEWWWEGPQDFGDGYEIGIDEGHQEGLWVCYENSNEAGYELGYSDYIDDYEYDDEPYGTYDYTSYETGYAKGWAQSESEDDSDSEEFTSNSSSYDSPNVSIDGWSPKEETKELTSAYKDTLFDDGYDEGVETAEGEFLYDDDNNDLNERELVVYKKGYFAGYIEGGAGDSGQIIYYYLFQKYLLATISIGTIFSCLISFFIFKKIRQKQADKSSVKIEKTFVEIITWIISGIAITIILIFFLFTIMDKTASFELEKPKNIYSSTSIDHNCDDFDTQEDAQLFYEANGGPEEDPHDLDRDDDGMACDWNP